MKKKFIYMAICLSAVLTGCSLDRFPLNGPSTGTFPASEEEALAGVLVSYKNLANSTQQYSPFPVRVMDMMTDIGTVRSGDTKYTKLLNSTATSEHAVVSYLYERIYKTAGRIHLVLDNIDNLKGKIEDEETYWQFKAELICLRAYIYDLGCQHYGAIPFIDHCLTLEDYAYPRMPREEVTARLLSEMSDELLDHLPVAWDYATWGHARIGRAAAYTLKARIALNWGHFEEAARCSKIAMELSKGVYSLTPLDCTYYADHTVGEPTAAPLFGFEGEKNSKEWMWGVQFDVFAAANTHAGAYTFSPRTHNGASYFSHSQALMDTFQCIDGKAITESTLFDPSNPWKNRDPRLELYCARPNTRLMGIQFSTYSSDKKLQDYNSGALVTNNDVPPANKNQYGPNQEMGPGGYVWRKYADPRYYGSVTSTSYEDELDVPIMRYAELLLIDAEANIEWAGGDLKRAADNINQVRARVNMPKVTGTTREELRSALRYERKVELCCEGFRWFDIRRWGIAEDVIDGPVYAPSFMQDGTNVGYVLPNAKPIIDENWTVKYDEHRTWEEGQTFNLRKLKYSMNFVKGKDELWPIPYTEMNTNPAIGFENNNPGY